MKIHKVNKVLISLDYNPTAQKVAEQGYTIAKDMGAEVFLLHVISDLIYYTSEKYAPIMGFKGYLKTGPIQLQSTEALKTSSLLYLDKVRLHLGDKTIQTVVAEGAFDEIILKTAKNFQADMIVLGSHSRKWLESIVMGSVTEKVLKHSTIPVLIIPTRKKQ